MITDEKKEWLEQIYIGFTKALFAFGTVPTMYMIAIDKKAEVIPQAPEKMPEDKLKAAISAYAKIRQAEFILHISESWMIEVKDRNTPVLPRPSQSPDRIEVLTLIIGEPSGVLSGIVGEIKRASDGTPYVENWEWGHNMESPSHLVQSFDD